MNSRLVSLIGLALLLSACANTPGVSSSVPSTNDWEIGKDDPSAITVTLNGKILRVNGSGYMKDFDSPASAPWSGADVSTIKISSKILSVGKNAFGSLPVEQVIIPKDIETVGEGGFNAKTKILGHAPTEFASGMDVYLYSNDIPAMTTDHYWQSDKTSGNIVPNDYVSTPKRVWFYDDEDELIIQNPTKVLFIGNSFTYRNGVLEYSGGIPGLFNGIAESLGQEIEAFSITGPGWYLSNHAKSTDTCGKQIDRILDAVKDFDYVVLQEQSVNPFEGYASFLSGVQALKEKINAAQPNAKIYLYETWGSPFSANERKITVPEMEKKLDDAYTNAGKETDLPVTYVGRAFRDVYLNHSEINLYGTDNRHQGFPGAYLSAATHVQSMLGLDVRDATYQGSKEWSEPILADTVYETLLDTAYRAGRGEIESYIAPIEPIESSSNSGSSADEGLILRVACWGRFTKEAKFQKLMGAYGEYLATLDLAYETIDPKYYQGATNADPYYYIANFTAQIVADQSPIDIVLPCADNFNANQSNLAAVELEAINVYGQTGRRVARFNDDDMTMSFFEFALTDAATTIFAEAD